MREPSLIDRIVEQNDALWAFLKSDGLSREERLELLKRAFPGAKSLQESDGEVPP
jgi:hypothetical protein